MKLEAKSLLAALNDHKIEYKLFEHEAFFTVEESSKLKSDLNMQGAHTKNLFLRDKKRNFYLLSCLDRTEVDLKIIKKLPLLNIYGGKLTTYRKLSEKVLIDLKRFLPKTKKGPWTDKKKLF